MTTPRWLRRARTIRDDIIETNAAIRQILGDRATRATFEGNVIERIQLKPNWRGSGSVSPGVSRRRWPGGPVLTLTPSTR